MPRLSREDFIVVEGGERWPIVGFNAEADGPVKVAVLFDISGSMRVGTKSVDAQQAARHLFSSLKKGDEAALFAFDTQLQKVTGFDRLQRPRGESRQGRAAVRTDIALRRHRRDGEGGGCRGGGRHVGSVPQRAAIVVLTDGIDTKSRLTPQESVSRRQQHRRAGLHRRGDVAGGRPEESRLRHGGLEQRLDGPGAMDGRRFLHRDRTRARERGGGADCR